MNKRYFVKSRNFYCKRWVKSLLDVTLFVGAYRGDSYEDGDGKYCLDTDSIVLALVIWAYYMALRRWSGGWTYILNNKTFKGFDGKYKSIYL